MHLFILLFFFLNQSRPIIIRAGSRDEMIGWVRALHAAKAAVNDIIMLKVCLQQQSTVHTYTNLSVMC